jgi:3-oxoacyl-[acyl-carrier protein] reductase
MNEKRVALVTGGSRGIGAAIVKRLAKDGCHVVAMARNADKLNEVVEQVKATEGSAEGVTCDIADGRDPHGRPVDHAEQDGADYQHQQRQRRRRQRRAG